MLETCVGAAIYKVNGGMAFLETAESQAPGFYERHGYERVATWPDSRFHLDWHLYRKPIAV